MLRSSLLLSLLLAVACDAGTSNSKKAAEPVKTEPVKTAEPVKTEPVKAEPVQTDGQADRSKDPAFALKKDGDRFIGFVDQRCPAGFRGGAIKPEQDPKIEDGKLVLVLPSGGCPRWTGYAVVPGAGSPLPFYVCDDLGHDPCEALMHKTWVFDISAALKANNATAVTYAVPTGVH